MRKVSILDVCILNDKTVKKYSGTRKYVATGGVDKNSIISFAEVSFDEKPSRANREVEVGDILLAKMKDTEKVLLIDENNKDYIYSTGFFTIKPNTSVVSTEYINYVLRSEYFQNEKDKLSKGATQKALNNAGLKKIKIPLPSKSEQDEIIRILKTVESIKSNRQQQIEALLELKQSVFLDMFGDPVSNPNRWRKAILGDYLLDIRGGWSPRCHSRSVTENEWGVLNLSSITKGYYDYEFNKALPQEDDPRTELEVKNNDLLFNRKNTPELVGTSAFVFETRKQLLFPDTIFRLELTEDLNKIFLWQMFKNQSVRKEIKHLASGSAKSMSNISQRNLKQLEIIIPDLIYQEQFEKYIRKINKQKNILLQSLEQMHTLYDSLLHKAFNGELFKENTNA